MTQPISGFLRRALLIDAAASAASAVPMILAAPLLERLLGLPQSLLLGAGLAMLPYVLFLGYLAYRRSAAAGIIWLVICANIAWAAACLALLASGKLAPTPFGIAFVLAQAVAVLLFGELQFIGLRRGRVAMA